MSRGPRALLAASALLAFALAGCAAGDDDSADVLQQAKDALAAGDLVLYLNVTAAGQTYSFRSDNPSPPTPQVPPLPPPTRVEATVEATGLPDDADLAWSLDFGDAAAASGTEANASASGDPAAVQPQQRGTAADLPATFHHEYVREGTHRLAFALALAGEHVGDVTAPIRVAGNGTAPGSVEPGTVLGTQAFNQTGEFPLGVAECGEPDAESRFEWPFESAFNGTPAQVSEVVLRLDSSGTVQDADLYLLDANGTELAAATEAGPDETLQADGPFPPGLYTVKVVACNAVDGAFALDGEATYVAVAGNGTAPSPA